MRNLKYWYFNYDLGDSQVEYQILDKMSFKTFLGLETGDKFDFVFGLHNIWIYGAKY